MKLDKRPNSIGRDKGKKPLMHRGKCRYFVSVTMSVEDYNLMEDMRDLLKLSRSEIQHLGYKMMLDIKQQVEGQISIQDYVKVYTRTTSPITLTMKPHHKRRKLYVYRLEKISHTRYLVFYKNDPNPEDLTFKVMEINQKRVTDDVKEAFPEDILDVHKELYAYGE